MPMPYVCSSNSFAMPRRRSSIPGASWLALWPIRASEERAVAALNARIAELEKSGRQALCGGRSDLAEEAATVIAATEDERRARQSAVDRFSSDVRRLKQLSEDGRRRLLDLRRGLEMARAQEALHRAGANGRRALATGTGALREAEATLTRIRELNARDEDMAIALDELDRQTTSRDLDERLAAAGFGAAPRTDPADVLARMRSSVDPAAGTRDPSDDKETP